MGSIGLNRENCTILCTLYENGNVDLPLHQDNEPSIEEGSTIYTISCGSTRNLKVYNTTGSLREFVIPMRDGTVHAMTSDSQNSWRHGIDREPSVTTPRISFTIRKLVSVPPSSQSPSISNIPPIAPNVLADLVCRKLEACCRKYSDTNFVFNSITHTKGKDWLNREIKIFNDYMYDLSRRLPNLSFFSIHTE